MGSPSRLISHLCQLRAFGVAIFTRRGYYVMGFQWKSQSGGRAPAFQRELLSLIREILFVRKMLFV
jgi:hypothetical protein